MGCFVGIIHLLYDWVSCGHQFNVRSSLRQSKKRGSYSACICLVFDALFFLLFSIVDYNFVNLFSDFFIFFQALEKSKYEQSLESVRRFIANAEKELELYYRHVALYGDPNDRNPNSIFDKPRRIEWARKVEGKEVASSMTEECSHTLFQTDIDSMDDEILESEEISEFDDKHKNNAASASEIDYEDDGTHIGEIESCDEETGSVSYTRILGSGSVHQSKWNAE